MVTTARAVAPHRTPPPAGVYRTERTDRAGRSASGDAISVPTATSPPRGRTFAPGSTASGTVSAPSCSSTSSMGTTASAPRYGAACGDRHCVAWASGPGAGVPAAILNTTGTSRVSRPPDRVAVHRGCRERREVDEARAGSATPVPRQPREAPARPERPGSRSTAATASSQETRLTSREGLGERCSSPGRGGRVQGRTEPAY